MSQWVSCSAGSEPHSEGHCDHGGMRRLWLPSLLLALAGCNPFVPAPERFGEIPPAGTTTLVPQTSVTAVEFSSSIEAVTAAVVPHSWRPGCPVSLEDLRLLSVTYWGFDQAAHQGALVVHADHADGVVAVMRQLFAERFPIERMELVDAYDGNDDRSMAANNTSAFNCREVSRRPGTWSQHAFGSAIDVNPVQNPYILRDGTVLPPGAETDRTTRSTGLITADSVVVSAFADIGWSWGGAWSSGVLDYQHFSASGS